MDCKDIGIRKLECAVSKHGRIQENVLNSVKRTVNENLADPPFIEWHA